MAGELFTYSQLYISKEVVVLKKNRKVHLSVVVLQFSFAGAGCFGNARQSMPSAYLVCGSGNE